MSQEEDSASFPQSPGHFLKHAKSGLYVQPEVGGAAIGSRLLLLPGPHRNRKDWQFEFRADGSLIHVSSGLAVHPAKDCSGAELVLLRDSPDRRCQFTHDADGCFYFCRGRDRFYVHPNQGKGVEGAHLMLHPDGPDRAFKGEIRYLFEAEHEILLEGCIMHCRSGLYVHPEGGAGVSGVRLVLHHDKPRPIEDEQRLIFTLRAGIASPPASPPFPPPPSFQLLPHTQPDGNLQHTESGLFVHPLKGSAYSGCPLVLHPDGPEQRLAFQTIQSHDLAISGFFTHAATGLCLAPKGGKATSGIALVFTDDIQSVDADFRFVSADETRAIAAFSSDASDAAAELSAEAAKLALEQRGRQLDAASEKSRRLQAASEDFAGSAAKLRQEQEKKASFWPF